MWETEWSPKYMTSEPERFYTPLLSFLLVACVACFWISLLPESFWLDETVTAFVIRHGAGHPSLAAGPRLDQTVYYWLPRVSQMVFGFSEFSVRLPSLLATLVGLWLIGRIAARLIHPHAGWFAIFLCFIPHEFTRQATDARPYGFGTCVSLAALWFLIRWLDRDGWRDGLLFILFGALLLRVHLIYWPFYLVFGLYSLARRVRNETPVAWSRLVAVWAVLLVSLVPLVPVTLNLFREEKEHVVTALPGLMTILGGFQLPLIAATAAAFWICSRVFRWTEGRVSLPVADRILLLAWCLVQPGFLLAASWITGNAVFLPRYFSLALPGLFLVCTLAAAVFVPARLWKPVAIVLALGVLIGKISREPFPPSRNSHWREAAQLVNDMRRGGDLPVMCPSPFVEAEPPVWNAEYALPGFLYAHLDSYPVQGSVVLLSARAGPEGTRYAKPFIARDLVPARRFVIYGGTYSVVNIWTLWFAVQPELEGWTRRVVGNFGDAIIVLFEAPTVGSSTR